MVLLLVDNTVNRHHTSYIIHHRFDRIPSTAPLFPRARYFGTTDICDTDEALHNERYTYSPLT